jgi:hypothetical protein
MQVKAPDRMRRKVDPLMDARGDASMISTDRIRRHAALLDGMAGSAGLDLQDLAISGRMSMDNLASAVLRCAACAHPDRCVDWLRAETRALPDFCLNKPDLQELADNARP